MESLEEFGICWVSAHYGGTVSEIAEELMRSSSVFEVKNVGLIGDITNRLPFFWNY